MNIPEDIQRVFTNIAYLRANHNRVLDPLHDLFKKSLTTQPRQHPFPDLVPQFASAEPQVTISFQGFPHIIQLVIHHVEEAHDKKTLLALRATCCAISQLVDRHFARHIQMTSVIDLNITHRYLGRIPALFNRGHISVGATCVKDNTASPPDTAAHFLLMTTIPKSEWPVWLSVPRASLAWFNNFMSHVKTLDLDLSDVLPMFPANRATLAKYEPRAILDGYRVPHICLFPHSEGGTWYHIPFSAPSVQHIVDLHHPAVPSTKTWIERIPVIPEGVIAYEASVYIHPEVTHTANEDSTVFANYPSTLETLTVSLAMVPPTAAPTEASFNAILAVFSKLFANYREGILVTIKDLHRWDKFASWGSAILVFRHNFLLSLRLLMPATCSEQELNDKFHGLVKFVNTETGVSVPPQKT